jgi:hypothetical protein
MEINSNLGRELTSHGLAGSIVLSFIITVLSNYKNTVEITQLVQAAKTKFGTLGLGSHPSTVDNNNRHYNCPHF